MWYLNGEPPPELFVFVSFIHNLLCAAVVWEVMYEKIVVAVVSVSILPQSVKKSTEVSLRLVVAASQVAAANPLENFL